MMAVLTNQNLKVALDGRDKKPATMKDSEWEEADQKALSTIQLSITDDVLQEVLSEKTAASLWNKLESLYLKKTVANRLGVLQRLYMLRMAEGTSIRTHISEFTSLIMDLKNMDETFSSEQQAMMLLCSLPPSYKHFRETLIYGRERLDIDEVKSALMSREKMEHDNSRHDDPAAGLFARGRSKEVGSSSHSRWKSRSKSRQRRGRCHYCKKEGHWKTECPKLKERKAADTSNVVSVAEGAENVLSVCTTSVGDAWIIDSGCSYHMCPNRDWFTTYQIIEGGVVLMGNNMSCKVIGIGTVKIKMHDGVVRTLTEVRHIPELKKNLISLGTLDSQGCKYSAEGGVLKVSKGALIVIKGKLVNGLYLLQGSTVVGAAAVSSSHNSELDTTHLWHMRLGHMSEAGMSILSKRDLLGDSKIGKLDFCEYCVYKKQTRVKFSTVIHRTKGTVDYIHSNL